MAEGSSTQKLQQQLKKLEAENSRLSSEVDRLRENEARYRGLVEYVGAAFFAIGADGKVIYLSPDIEVISEFQPEELIGLNFLDYVYPPDRQEVYDAFIDNMAGKFDPTEFRIVTKSGEIRWVRSFARSAFGDEGTVTEVRGGLLDINEKKLYEQALEDRTRRLESILHHSSLAVVTLDAAGAVTAVNRHFEKLFKMKPDDILGLTVDEVLVDPDQRKQAEEFTSKALAGQSIHGTAVRRRGDGTVINVEFHGVPVIVESQVVGAYVLYWDATELVRAREAIKEKEKLYRVLFESAGDAIIILKDSTIVECNHRTLELFGYTRQEILGLAPYEISPPNQSNGQPSATAAIRYIKQAIKGEAITFEWLHRKRDKTDFNAEVSLTRIDTADGPVLQAIVRDVSQRKQDELALRESEEKYRTLLEISGDGYYEVDLKGNFIFFNKAFSRMLAYSPEKLKMMKYTNFTSPLNIEQAYKDFNWVFKTRTAARGLQWKVVRGDGGTIDLEVSVALMRDQLGNIVGFRGLAQDISDRKRAEEALRQSEEKYKALYDNALAAIFRTTVDDGRVLEANDVFMRLFGYATREEMLKHCRTSEHYSDPQARQKIVHLLNKNGRVDSFVTELVRTDGTPFWVDISAKLYHDEAYIEGAFIDITDRKLAEEALLESERRYRELFNTISDFIVTHDQDGRILEVNPAICNAMGYAKEELEGSLISDFVVPEYRDLVVKDYLKTILDKGHADGVFVVLAKDGSRRYLEYSNTLVKKQEKVLYILGSNRDVTERINAEHQLKRMQEQLLQSQKLEAIGTLASGISHDFNNLLQAISGYVQLLIARNSLGPEDNRYLLQMDLAARRGADLVQRLLTFSRKVKPELRPLDFNRQVSETSAVLERTIPRMITIETRLADDLYWINGDEAQVEQVIMNLGTNARDAMPDGGTLTFETRNINITNGETAPTGLKSGRYIHLRVTDSGEGMDSNILDHIFEPFFTTKEVGQGTGLGLSTVYGIVESHGGIITAKSAPKQGTVFDLFIPALEKSPAVEDDDLLEIKSNQGGKERLLVVDDEAAILEVAREVLGGQGYSVVTAKSGEQALSIFEQNPSQFDLVLLDLGMPGMGGHRCLEAMLDIRPDMKIIIASGYADDRQIQEVLKSGAAEFIRKPYRLTSLLEQVRLVLDKTP
jgi:two-component system cell cycle sensor histidine kinase/response regulator CckA